MNLYIIVFMCKIVLCKLKGMNVCVLVLSGWINVSTVSSMFLVRIESSLDRFVNVYICNKIISLNYTLLNLDSNY